MQTLAVGHDEGRKSNGQYSSGMGATGVSGGSSSSSLSLEEDLNEFFLRKLRALLEDRWPDVRRGSELDRRKVLVGGLFFSFFLGAVRCIVEVGVGDRGVAPLLVFQERTGWPPRPWTRMMLELGQ